MATRRDVAQTYQHLAIYDLAAVHVSSSIKGMMLRTANGGIARSTTMSSGLLPVFWEPP
jgi:hypothetical protein